MQFLETIEGATGEQLTSALLKFLLVNSATMRDKFVAHFNTKIPASRLPTFRDGILCQTEYLCDSDGDKGRIDLLIREASGMVFGVENKLWAPFTPDQPKKYFATLQKLAAAKKDACWIIVLSPEARKKEVEKHLCEQGILQNCIQVFWEQITKDLEVVRRDERVEIASVGRFFEEYLTKYAIEKNFEIDAANLVGRNVCIGNDFQYEFLYRLRACFPSPGRLSPAANWIGFNFVSGSPDTSSPESKPPVHWFGFARREGTDEIILGIDLGIDSNVPDHSLPEGFQKIKMFDDHAFIQACIVSDPLLKQISDWEKRLEPVLKSLRRP